jgi:hypothetical protein
VVYCFFEAENEVARALYYVPRLADGGYDAGGK